MVKILRNKSLKIKGKIKNKLNKIFKNKNFLFEIKNDSIQNFEKIFEQNINLSKLNSKNIKKIQNIITEIKLFSSKNKKNLNKIDKLYKLIENSENNILYLFLSNNFFCELINFNLKEINEEISLKKINFLDNISIKDYINLMINNKKYIIKNWKLENIKDLLYNLSFHSKLISKIFLHNNIIQNYQKNFLYEIFINENYLNFYYLNFISFNIENYDKFTDLKINNKENNIYNIKTIILDFEDSDFFIIIYIKILHFFYPDLKNTETKILKDEIKNKLITYLNNINIYFVDFPLFLIGKIIYNGDIYIQKKYLDYFNESENIDKLIIRLLIHISLLSLISISLFKIYKKENNNLNEKFKLDFQIQNLFFDILFCKKDKNFLCYNDLKFFDNIKKFNNDDNLEQYEKEFLNFYDNQKEENETKKYYFKQNEPKEYYEIINKILN